MTHGRDPDLRALRAFATIVRTGTVTAAGRELGLSQPATSRLLAQFERSIGFTLFHRDRGRLRPTADALLLFEEAELALGNIGHVRDLIEDIARFRVGRLHLVAPPSFSEGVLPEIVAGFLRRFPDVHLSIDARSVETAKRMIATRAVDAGFVKTPVDRDDLAVEPVASSGTVCVLPATHPLAGERHLDPSKLRGVPLILLGLGGRSRVQVESAFAEAGVVPNVRIDTHTIGSACGFASRGIGVAVVNALLARTYLRDGLVALPFRPELRHEYAFVTAAVPGLTRLAREFLVQTREWFASTGSLSPRRAARTQASSHPRPSRRRSR
jgi:DNA-binding transcriptional LysR family regulator